MCEGSIAPELLICLLVPWRAMPGAFQEQPMIWILFSSFRRRTSSPSWLPFRAYEPPHQFNLIHVPSALKADFWLLRPIPFEREMFSRRVKDAWFGETTWLATAEDVILHKLYWNRITPSDRQLGDVAGVVAVQQGRLDQAYLRSWAAELGLAAELEAALSGRLKPKQT